MGLVYFQDTIDMLRFYWPLLPCIYYVYCCIFVLILELYVLVASVLSVRILVKKVYVHWFDRRTMY